MYFYLLVLSKDLLAFLGLEPAKPLSSKNLVEAGKRILGKNYITSIRIEDLDDAAMLRHLAAENSTNETDSVAAQVDIVLCVKKGLEESSITDDMWCKSMRSADDRIKRGQLIRNLLEDALKAREAEQ